jgi:hypothetical protein
MLSLPSMAVMPTRQALRIPLLMNCGFRGQCSTLAEFLQTASGMTTPDELAEAIK